MISDASGELALAKVRCQVSLQKVHAYDDFIGMSNVVDSDLASMIPFMGG